MATIQITPKLKDRIVDLAELRAKKLGLSKLSQRDFLEMLVSEEEDRKDV